jgi:hypothetical protein
MQGKFDPIKLMIGNLIYATNRTFMNSEIIATKILAPVIMDINFLLQRVESLVLGAQKLTIPILVTEHCLDRIGPAVDAIRKLASDAKYLGKTYFGAARETLI